MGQRTARDEHRSDKREVPDASAPRRSREQALRVVPTVARASTFHVLSRDGGNEVHELLESEWLGQHIRDAKFLQDSPIFSAPSSDDDDAHTNG